MDEYTTLVSRILKNDHLNLEVEKMRRNEKMSNTKPPTINLVTLDWEATLENDITFQDCDFHPDQATTSQVYNYETTKQAVLNVTLVGICKFAKPYEGKVNTIPSIMVANSQPLTKIARAVLKNLDSSYQLSDEFKFSFKTCSSLSCKDCSSSLAHFANNGYIVSKFPQPCICDTKIFDGKNIVNRFHSQMVEMFTHTFMGIMNLKIDARYNYADRNNPNQKLYRISGTVTHLLAFNEAKLDMGKSVHLGDIANITSLMDLHPSLKQSSKKEDKVPDNFLKEMLHPNEEETQLDFPFPDIETTFPTVSDSDSLLGGEDEEVLLELKGDHPAKKRSHVEEDFFSIKTMNNIEPKKPRCETTYLSID